MTVQINGTTGTSLAQDATITQAKLAANIAGNGPAFSAKTLSNITPTNATWQKLTADVKDFDTTTAYDAVTNFRFLPQTAGYYQVTAFIQAHSTITALLSGAVGLNKNTFSSYPNLGTSSFQYGTSAHLQVSPVSTVLVYLNGTTDYIEAWALVSANSGSQLILAGAKFSGFLARAA